MKYLAYASFGAPIGNALGLVIGVLLFSAIMPSLKFPAVRYAGRCNLRHHSIGAIVRRDNCR